MFFALLCCCLRLRPDGRRSRLRPLARLHHTAERAAARRPTWRVLVYVANGEERDDDEDDDNGGGGGGGGDDDSGASFAARFLVGYGGTMSVRIFAVRLIRNVR